MKFGLQKTLVRGSFRWVVSWKQPKKPRCRAYFKSKTEAEAKIDELSLQRRQAGEIWLSLNGSERNELISILDEARKAEFTLREAVDYFVAHRTKTVSKTLGAAFAQFMEEKIGEKLSASTLAALRSNVGRFIKGREMVVSSSITREDVKDWLATFTDATFNTYLTSLNTFFIWCENLEIVNKRPTLNIKKIDRRRMENYEKPPRVFTVEELRALLRATLLHDPGLIRYVTICAFAGLRPEREAKLLAPGDIRDEIYVSGKSAKDIQSRYVPILPVLKEWLALPFQDFYQGPCITQLGPLIGDWPIKNLRRRFERVRVLAGICSYDEAGKLVGWEQDIMRHTFASIYFVLHGAEKTKEAMGHGDYEMLFRHYRNAGMTKADAEKFLKLSPAEIISPSGAKP